MRAFTFIELLIVIGIISVLLLLTIPLGIGFYKGQQLDSVAEGVLQNLRRAQLRAMSQSDYDFGVYFGSGNIEEYILFQGDSYANGENEEVFDVPKGIYFSGLEEVVFSRTAGEPFLTGDISITNEISNVIISINNLGRISYAPPEPPPPQGCWGTGGECDPLCHYDDYGIPTAAYREPIPPCNRECNPARNIFIDPSGACRDDGTDNCYKMTDPTTGYTECIQRESCEGRCEGICTPCREIIDPQECEQQEGCRAISSPGVFICRGECVSCEEFSEGGNCSNQLGCGWDATAWYWELASPQSGYFNYVTCEWYEE
jgi:prepilin-type N-terminal cleavage/methylation domain-containing protein